MKYFLQYYIAPFLIGFLILIMGTCVVYLLFTHYIFRLIFMSIFGGLFIIVGLWMVGILILGIVGYDFLVKHDEGFKRDNEE